MRDLGRERHASGLGDSPALSVLALVAGIFFVIPGIWTFVTTNMRIHRAGKLLGVEKPLNGWILAARFILTFGFATSIYMQYKLNRAWETQPRAEGEPGPEVAVTG